MTTRLALAAGVWCSLTAVLTFFGTPDTDDPALIEIRQSLAFVLVGLALLSFAIAARDRSIAAWVDGVQVGIRDDRR